jgi:hypothetical protein
MTRGHLVLMGVFVAAGGGRFGVWSPGEQGAERGHGQAAGGEQRADPVDRGQAQPAVDGCSAQVDAERAARVKAEMFAADATSGACPAALITRSCSGATTANAATPNRNIISTAAGWLCRAGPIATSATAKAPSVPRIAGMSRRSASFPPRWLPTNSPAPNSSSNGVIHPPVKPADLGQLRHDVDVAGEHAAVAEQRGH